MKGYWLSNMYSAGYYIIAMANLYYTDRKDDVSPLYFTMCNSLYIRPAVQYVSNGKRLTNIECRKENPQFPRVFFFFNFFWA